MCQGRIVFNGFVLMLNVTKIGPCISVSGQTLLAAGVPTQRVDGLTFHQTFIAPRIKA